MSRPEVTIVPLGPVIVGAPLSLDIAITMIDDDELEVHEISLQIQGKQGWEIGAGRSRVTYEQTHPDHEAVLSGPTTLRGTTQFRHQLELPPTMAPTHDIRPAWAHLIAKLRLTKRWLDPTFEVELVVDMPQRTVEPTPTLVRSRAIATDQPIIEVGLASSRVAPGGTISGSCALFHVDDSRPRHLDVSFVPNLVLLGRAPRERRGRRMHYALVIPKGAAGTSVPFELAIPATATPTFATMSHELTWRLTVSLDSWLGFAQAHVHIPIEMIAGAPSGQTLAAPHVADRRVIDMLAQVVGWRLTDELAIARDVGDCRLHIKYDYRGETGTFVVSRIEHAPFGLDLSVARSSVLRSLFVRDVEVDIAAWDRRHHVVVRSPDQAMPALRAVVPTLLQLGSLGEIVRWTDDEIVFEQPIIDLDATELASAASELERLANVLDAAHHLIAPPLDADLEAWRELARWLDGALVLGDLSIHGALDGVRVQLGLVFDGATPTGVHVEVGEPRDSDRVGEAPDLGDVRDLRIAPGVASATIDAIDPVRTRVLVETLRGVVADRAGPYR